MDTTAPAPTAHDVAVATAVREVESALAALGRAAAATDRVETSAGVDAYVLVTDAWIAADRALELLRARPAAADVSTPLCACGHPHALHSGAPAVDGRAGCRAQSTTGPGRCACAQT